MNKLPINRTRGRSFNDDDDNDDTNNDSNDDSNDDSNNDSDDNNDVFWLLSLITMVLDLQVLISVHMVHFQLTTWPVHVQAALGFCSMFRFEPFIVWAWAPGRDTLNWHMWTNLKPLAMHRPR